MPEKLNTGFIPLGDHQLLGAYLKQYTTYNHAVILLQKTSIDSDIPVQESNELQDLQEKNSEIQLNALLIARQGEDIRQTVTRGCFEQNA